MDYIQNTLERQTYRYFTFSKQYFFQPEFSVISPPQLLSGNTTFVYGKDFGQFAMSGSGNINEKIQFVPNVGCIDADWAGFVAGNIAMVSRGTCAFQLKVDKAIAAKANGIIIINTDNTIFEGGLGRASTIPVYVVPKDLGNSWNGIPDFTLNMIANNKNSLTTTYNLFADTIAGDASNMIVIGAHADGVPAGPGCNDNGSGSSVILEVALQFFKEGVRPTSKVRFAWWAGEELGLLGSQFFVDSLSDDAIKNIALNLNYDMLGSPNYFRGVYDGSGAVPEIRTASINIQKVFEGYFNRKGLGFDLSAFDGRSDYGPFIARRVPAGGLAAGAEGVKTEAQRIKTGGIAGIAYDPCYHGKCDTFANINPKAIEEMGGNAAYSAHFLATNGNLKAFLGAPIPAETTSKSIVYEAESDNSL
jgi:Zn-dependent M28 family amino/carboxypeptidase